MDTEKGRYLDSWKEIAAYLGRNIRTCWLWERELGMPVHRLDGSPKARVFAWTGEIDAWREARGQNFGKGRPGIPKRSWLVLRIGDRRIETAHVLAGLAGLVVLILALLKVIPPPPPDHASIAVLPLADLSPRADQAAWCEGISDSLISALSKINSLRVRGRLSAFLFSVRDDVREVGRKLRVDEVLTGSLQRSEDRMRITVQLVRAVDGTLIWSETWDGRVDDIFDIQDKIASTVAAKLDVRIPEPERRALAKRYTNDKDAYDLYLKARYVERSVDPAQMQKAIPLYLAAIEKDPRFVLPYIALIRDYTALFVSFSVMPRDEAYLKAKEAAAQAMALDPEHGAVWATLANLIYSFEHDIESAERHYRRALKLSPRDPDVLEHHSIYLVERGRLEESLEDCRLLVEIDPLLPQNHLYSGMRLYFLRRYEESAAAYEQALDFDPYHLNSLGWCIWTYLAQGRDDKALAAAARFDRANPGPPISTGCRAIIAAAAGKREEAEVLMEAGKEGTNGFDMAIYYAALGDRERALAMLTEFYTWNPGVLSFCFLNHFFDKYRTDPEFVALLRRSGFER